MRADDRQGCSLRKEYISSWTGDLQIKLRAIGLRDDMRYIMEVAGKLYIVHRAKCAGVA